MNYSSRTHHRKSSLTKSYQPSILRYSNSLRKVCLGKFSTSDFDEQIYNDSQPGVEQQEQIITEQSGENIVVSLIQRPYIDSKLVNSIFPSEKIHKIIRQKSFNNKFLLPSTFNNKDKVVNDYVVSKLKTIINNKINQEQFHVTKLKLEQYYSVFLQTFSITDLKKVFQCLQNNRNISLCKQYIINQLFTYYSSRSRQKSHRKQNYQNILQIKMNTNLIKQHQTIVLKAKQNIENLSTCRKEIQRTSTSAPKQHRITKIKKLSDLVDQQLRIQNTELVRQTEIINRLQKAENILKKNMCSGQYCESGFGELYNDFVENGLDQRVFSAFLGPKQMQFLKQKSSIERQITELTKSSFDKKLTSRRKAKNQISKLKNQMIVMEEDIINKLKNDRHLQKNVFSLFGCGEKGKSILERIRLNSPIKS